jgi:hypothetical protein
MAADNAKPYASLVAPPPMPLTNSVGTPRGYVYMSDDTDGGYAWQARRHPQSGTTVLEVVRVASPPASVAATAGTSAGVDTVWYENPPPPHRECWAQPRVAAGLPACRPAGLPADRATPTP